MQEVAECADLILFDLKLIDPDLHTRYTGMSNEKILKNLKMLDQNNINLRIRIPLIPGITDTHSNIMAIIEFLRKLKHPHSVDLIDYHAMAENKYQKWGMDFKMKQMKVGKADPRAILELFTDKDIKAYSAS
ncbi:MAG: hypothetical protein U5Q03_02820 [Bacteroidota bacterium]|nr:hypothetical protein [Bacteroidota bacterium]